MIFFTSLKLDIPVESMTGFLVLAQDLLASLAKPFRTTQFYKNQHIFLNIQQQIDQKQENFIFFYSTII